MRSIARWTSLALMGAWLAGCATAPPAGEKTSPLPGGQTTVVTPTPAPVPASTPRPASPMPGTPVGTTASGGVITSGNRPTVLDTLPTADAKAVLETIPEPLPPDQRVPPKAGAGAAVVAGTAGASASPDSVAADTSRSEGDVPVPSPTEPIGDKPGAAPPAGSSTPPPPPPPSGSAGAPSTSSAECWRVQLAAPPEADRAEKLKSAAESQLGVSCVVEKEKTLYKVRTRECQDSAASDATRKRAIDSGFSGAFKIRDTKK